MARRKGTSRVTKPGTPPANERPATPPPPPGLPSLRQRRPAMFWALIVAVLAMMVPVIIGFVQAVT